MRDMRVMRLAGSRAAREAMVAPISDASAVVATSSGGRPPAKTAAAALPSSVRQAGFDGDFETRDLSLEQGISCYAPTQEVSR